MTYFKRSMMRIENLMMVLSVPQDVLSIIIDEARYDRETLKVCSLASSSLLHHSRRHLHRVFTLKHADYNTISVSDSERLSQLSLLPALVDYAEEFRLIAVDRKYLQDSCSDRRADFWSVVRRFKHVRKVRFVNLDWAWGPRTALQDKINLVHAFPTVYDLAIVSSTFADTDEIMALALQFPQLSTLRLTQNTGIRIDALPPPDPQGVEYALEATPSLYSRTICTADDSSVPVPRRIQIVGCHSDQAGALAVRNLLRASPSRQVESFAMSFVLNQEDHTGASSLMPLIHQSLLDLHIVAQQGDSLARAYPKFDSISRGA